MSFINKIMEDIPCARNWKSFSLHKDAVTPQNNEVPLKVTLPENVDDNIDSDEDHPRIHNEYPGSPANSRAVSPQKIVVFNAPKPSVKPSVKPPKKASNKRRENVSTTSLPTGILSPQRYIDQSQSRLKPKATKTELDVEKLMAMIAEKEKEKVEKMEVKSDYSLLAYGAIAMTFVMLAMK